MKWRPTLFKLHRDIGFLCLGLTVVYCISGVAVNHRHHWDYNYAIRTAVQQVGSPAALLGLDPSDAPQTALEHGQLARERESQLIAGLLTVLGRSDAPYKTIWMGPDRLSLLFGESDRDIVDYLPSRGIVEHTTKRDRFLLRELNVLHLNEHRQVWTWFADLYAVLLMFLAISGVVMVRGRHSLRKRGGILAAIGVAIPILALWLLR